MKIEELKEYIKNNENEFPLSFKNLEYTQNDYSSIKGKTSASLKYKDSDYSIFKFYKSITRFK